MEDPFAGHYHGLDSPASKAAAVTPHDTNPLPTTSRALYVGTGGNVAVKLANDSAAVTFVGVPAGTVLPVRAGVVLATGTTASNILALS